MKRCNHKWPSGEDARKLTDWGPLWKAHAWYCPLCGGRGQYANGTFGCQCTVPNKYLAACRR